MARHLAVVDTKTRTVFVEYRGVIIEYDMTMYAAAQLNPKYWDHAEVRMMPDDCRLPDLVTNQEE